jgi:hypothetical protein
MRSTVAAVESGERPLTLEEFLLLPLALSRLVRRDLRLADLISGLSLTSRAADELRVAIGALEIEHSALAVYLRGRKVAASGAFTRPGRKVSDLEDVTSYTWGGEGPGGVARGREAEQRAARKFGVDVDQVAAAAERRWGRGLSEERDVRLRQRVGKDMAPQQVRAVRGHVTRELLEEIREAVVR